MLRYNNFLEDLILEKMIQESALYYTKEFKDKIYNIRFKSPIAQNLIDIEGVDVKADMTFISFGDEKGNIKFSQIKNILSLVKKYYKEKYEKNWDSFMEEWLELFLKRIENSEIKNNEINTLWNDGGIKDAKSRVETGIGRFVNKVFPSKYTSEEVEKFVNLFKKDEEDEDNFELVTGDEIIKWYNQNTYIQDSGDISGSCMRYSRCSTYSDIYTQNPEVCQLLILREGDKIKGRALVWKLSQGLGGAEYFMDRVYAIDEPTKLLFDDWANKKEYLRKNSNSQNQMKKFMLGKITPDGQIIEENIDGEIRVQLKKWRFDQYPYMDTFKKLEIKSGVLHNDNSRSKIGFYILESTSGEFENTSGKYSHYYSEEIPEDEAVYSDYLDDWIWRDSARRVTLGANRGWYPDDYDGIVYDTFRDRWVNSEDAVYSDWYGEYIYEEDAITCVTEIFINSQGNFVILQETLSSEDNEVIYIGDLDAAKFFEDKYDYEYFYSGLLGNSYGDRYIQKFKCEVYKVDDLELTELDAEVLGKEISGRPYATDIIAYTWKMDSELRSEIKKALESKIKEIEYKLSGKQTKIAFAQFDEEEDKKALEDKIKKYKERLKEIERYS